MDNVPIELLQDINDQLEFFDQIKFKSISKWFYDKITIKQYIPNILVRRRITCNEYHSLYYINLKELHHIYKKYIKQLTEEYHDIIVLIPNKQLNSPIFFQESRHDYRKIHDITTLIKSCLENVNTVLEFGRDVI